MLRRNFQPLTYGIIMILGLLVGRGLENERGKEGIIEEALQIVTTQYVDSQNYNQLKNEAIQGLLNTLDPHSVYIPSASLSVYNEPLQGNFQGIGIEYNILRDTVFVMRVFPNGPAAKSGVIAADKILRANGFLLVGKSNEEIAGRIKGRSGSKVELDIIRGEKGQEKKISIERGNIDIQSIPFYTMLSKTTGYMKITQFASTTKKEFDEAIEAMKENELRELVLDLRGNTGGYLQTAVEIMDEFLEGGLIITYTKERGGKRRDYMSSNGGSCLKIDLVCLVDEHTASASELVCGALQDHKRGTVMGRKTFGKGLVQEHFGLSDGSALRLTIARYYTPKGRSIQKPYGKGTAGHQDSSKQLDLGGITPDIVLNTAATKGDTLGHIQGAGDYRETLAGIMESGNRFLVKNKTAQSIIADKHIADIIAAAIKERNKDINTGELSVMTGWIYEQLIRNYLGEKEYYKWITKEDPWIKKALAELEK